MLGMIIIINACLCLFVCQLFSHHAEAQLSCGGTASPGSLPETRTALCLQAPGYGFPGYTQVRKHWKTGT